MRRIFALIYLCFVCKSDNSLPKGFSYIKDIAPSIKKELRYHSKNNFVGRIIDSYNSDVLITSTKAALSLKKVQDELLKKGLSLKVYDAYRPQSAVNHFVRWSRDSKDTITKQVYYPDYKKKNLFKLGYISTRSGHSRGSSVDLTIIDNKTQKELDMGSPYDFFGNISSTYSKKITPSQLKNRLLLRKVMMKYGFRPYSKEWWHFTLKNEPFPKKYFDFPVQ